MAKMKILSNIATPEEISSGAVPADQNPAPEPTADELLEMAKGVHLKQDHWAWENTSRREMIHFRREVRRHIYKILKWMRLGKDWKTDEKLSQLYTIINDQLDPNLGQRWSTFGDVWDIHPKIPTQIVLKDHWVKEGGGFDTDVNVHYPHAFPRKPNFNEG